MSAIATVPAPPPWGGLSEREKLAWIVRDAAANAEVAHGVSAVRALNLAFAGELLNALADAIDGECPLDEDSLWRVLGNFPHGSAVRRALEAVS